MHIVIMGAGKTGYSLTYKLIQEEQDVALIEVEPKKAKYADDNLDCLVIKDTGNNPEVLKDARIAKAEYFIALTGSDEMNMITCAMVSADFPKVRTIARIRNRNYYQTGLMAGSSLKIDHIIAPEIAVARKIIYTIETGARSEVMIFDNSPFQIRDISIDRGSAFIDLTLAEIKPNMPTDFLAVTILRGEEYIIPQGRTKIKENDFLYVLSTEEGFEKIFAQAGQPRKPLTNVLMIGCGQTGYYVADYLMDHKEKNPDLLSKFKNLFKKKYNLHIVDEDYQRCEELAKRYPRALVTNANISDDDFLELEQLQNYDLMINSTNIQELNIIAGVYGKKLGIERVISVVNKSGYFTICKHLDLDVTISKYNSVVNNILGIIRQGHMQNIHVIADSMLETTELAVTPRSRASGKKVSDLNIPMGSLILFILREGKSIIPQGKDVIQIGDHLIFMNAKSSVKKLEHEILAP